MIKPPPPLTPPAPTNVKQAALDYLSQHRDEINAAADRLGVPAIAIAASMAREQTRVDNQNFVLHGTALHLSRTTSEAVLESKLSKDEAILLKNPGAFDGNPRLGYLLDPIRRDIGPGSIKVISAIQIIQQYANTPAGKSAGFDAYGPHDLTKIVRDLADPNNPLSINVAAFAIMEGEKFFKGKVIDGIKWENLTPEQQDAALMAYYTVGEHAVSVDMSKGEFRPFTPGPGGGQVGPWLFHKQNFQNLQAALRNNPAAKPPRSALPSFAPVRRYGGPAPKVNTGQHSVPAGAELTVPHRTGSAASIAPLNRALQFAADRDIAASRQIKFINLAIKRAISAKSFQKASTPASNIQMLKSVIEKTMPAAAHTLDQAARGRLAVFPLSAAPNQQTLIDAVMRRVRTEQPGISSVSGSVTTKLAAMARRRALPSIAPIVPRYALTAKQQHEPALRHAPTQIDAVKQQTANLHAPPPISHADISQALANLLDDEARRPPSGMTGFDPRLSPAWAGLKLSI